MRNRFPRSSSAILDTIYTGHRLESYLMSYYLFLRPHTFGRLSVGYWGLYVQPSMIDRWPNVQYIALNRCSRNTYILKITNRDR